MDAAKLADLKRRWEADRTSRIFLQLAEEYRRLGQPADALPVLEEGLVHHASWLAAQVALGRCRLEAGQPRGASDALEAVLRRDPTQMVAYRLLVAAYLAMGDVKAAQERLDLYRELNPQDPELDELQRRVHRTAAMAAAPGPPPPPPPLTPVPGTVAAAPGAPMSPQAVAPAVPALTPPPPAMPPRSARTQAPIPPPIPPEPVYEPPSSLWPAEEARETPAPAAATPISAAPATLWPGVPDFDLDRTLDSAVPEGVPAAPEVSFEPVFDELPEGIPDVFTAEVLEEVPEELPYEVEGVEEPAGEALPDVAPAPAWLEAENRPLAARAPELEVPPVVVTSGRHGEPFQMSPLAAPAPDLWSSLAARPPRALRRRNGDLGPSAGKSGAAPVEPAPSVLAPPAAEPEPVAEYEIAEILPEPSEAFGAGTSTPPLFELPLAALAPPPPQSWLPESSEQPSSLPLHSFGTGSPFDLLSPGPEQSGGAPPRAEGGEGGRDAETVTLGSLYLEQGHADEARRIFESVLRQDPANEAAQVRLTELSDSGGETPPPERSAAEQLLSGYRPTFGDGLSEKKAYVLRSYLERIQQSRRDDVP